MGSALGKRVAPEDDGHFSAMEEGRGAAVVAASSEEVSEVEEGKGGANESAANERESIWLDLVFRYGLLEGVRKVLGYLAKKPPDALRRALEAPPPAEGFRWKLRRVLEWAMEEEDRVSDQKWWEDFRQWKAGTEYSANGEQNSAALQAFLYRNNTSSRERLWEKYFPGEEEVSRWGMAAEVRRALYGETPLEELGLGSREMLKYLARGNQSPADHALFRALEELPPLAEAEAEAAPPHFRAEWVVAESPEEEERLWKELKQRWAREGNELFQRWSLETAEGKMEEKQRRFEEREREREEERKVEEAKAQERRVWVEKLKADLAQWKQRRAEVDELVAGGRRWVWGMEENPEEAKLKRKAEVVFTRAQEIMDLEGASPGEARSRAIAEWKKENLE